MLCAAIILVTPVRPHAQESIANQPAFTQTISEADTQGPQVLINYPVEGQILLNTQANVLVDFNVTDACTGSPMITMTLDEGTMVGRLIDIRDIAQGPHTFCVRATDDCGNENRACVTFFVEQAPMACLKLQEFRLLFRPANISPNQFRLRGEFLLPSGLTVGELAGCVELIIESGEVVCSEKVQTEPGSDNKWLFSGNTSQPLISENIEIKSLIIDWSDEPGYTANTFWITGNIIGKIDNGTGTGVVSITLRLAVLSGGDLEGVDTTEARVMRRLWHFRGRSDENRCIGPVVEEPDPAIVISSPASATTTQDTSVEINGTITSKAGILDAVAEVNGVPHKITLDADGRFNILLPLITKGPQPTCVENEIWVRAVNSLGEESETVLSVLYIYEFEEGVVIVQFEEGTPAALVQDISSFIGATILDHNETLDMYLIELPEWMQVQDAIFYYSAVPLVIFAEPNYYVEPDMIPNDPVYLWWKQTSLAASNYYSGVEPAWNTASGLPSIIVAVVDSGLDHTHPDFTDNLWVNQGELPAGLLANGDVDGDGRVTLRDANLPGGRAVFALFGVVDSNANGLIDGADLLTALRNGLDDDGNGWVDDLIGYTMTNIPATGQVPNPDPMDCIGACRAEGHGTAVAGIIGATGNNNLGVTGMMWRVQIMPLRVEDTTTGGFNTWGITSAMTYAVRQRARIANNSFSLYTPQVPQAWFGTNGVYNLADSSGMLVCCSAGNRGLNNDLNPHWPGNLSTRLKGVIQVAGINANWNLANTQVDYYNTSFGPATVNITAPGTANMVYTTRVTTRQTSPGGIMQLAAIGYGQFFGTSAATPHVAGTAGLILSVNPGLFAPAVRRIVLGPSYPGYDGMTWSGKVQGNRILNPLGSLWFAQTTTIPRQVVASLGEYIPNPGFLLSDVRLFNPQQAYAQTGSFIPLGQATPGVGIESAAGDVDGDGVDDLIFAHNTPAVGFSLIVTDKSGNLKAQEIFRNWTSTIALYGTIATARFIGTGNSVIVIVTPQNNIESYLYNATRPVNMRLRLWQNLGKTFSWRAALAAGDVDFDGFDELAIAEPGLTGLVAPYVDIRKVSNQGLGTTIARITPYALGSVSRMDIALGDLDGDGAAEIITLPLEGLGPIKIYNASGVLLSQFGSYGGYPQLGQGQRVASGDVDNDGMDEIIIGCYSGLVEVCDWQPFFGTPAAIRTSTSLSAYGSGCPAATRIAISR